MSSATLQNITFVYFDLDDTLLDHKLAETNALQQTLRELDFLHDIPVELFRQTYHERNKELWQLYNHSFISGEELKRRRFSETLNEFGIDSERHETVVRTYMTNYRKHWQWVPGAEEVYRRIREAMPTGILTNGFSETQHKKLQEFGLVKNGEIIIVSEEVGYLKPDSRIFRYAAERAATEPHKVLYVGDSYESDIEGGNGAGFKTAWFTRSAAAHQNGKADVVFEDFTELLNYLPANK